MIVNVILQMSRLESTEKRQAFRLQIRSRQVSHKLSLIRSAHSLAQETHSDFTKYLWQHHPGQINDMVTMMTGIIGQVFQSISEGNYEAIGEKLQELAKMVADSWQKIQSRGGISREGGCRELLTVCVGEVLGRMGKDIVDRVRADEKMLEDEDEGLGGDYNGDENDYGDEDTKQQRENSPINGLLRIDQKQKEQGAQRISYQTHTKLLHELLQLLCQLVPTQLSLQPSLHLLLIARLLFKQIPEPSLSRANITCQYYQQLYLQVMYSMLCLLNNFIAKTNRNWQPCCDFVIQLGILDDARTLAEYVVQVSKNQARSSHTSESNMVQLHIALLQLIRNLETEQAEASQAGQYFISYCLYLVHAPPAPGPRGLKLHQLALCVLCHLLSLDTQVTAQVSLDSYQTVLHLVGESVGGGWSEEVELVLFAGLRVLYLGVDAGVDLIRVGALDHLHSLFRTLTIMADGECPGYSPNSYSVQSIMKQLSGVLSGLLIAPSKTNRRILQAHPIWNDIFEHLDQQMLPMLSVFPRYFLCLGRQTTIRDMHLLLDAVCKLQLNGNREEQNRIKNILYEIYTNCQRYLTEDQMENINSLFQTYRMDMEGWAQ